MTSYELSFTFPSLTAPNAWPSSFTFSVREQGRAVPWITSSSANWHVLARELPPHVAYSPTNRAFGSWPSAVVKTYRRMCSSRSSMPVFRLSTGTVASSPSISRA